MYISVPIRKSLNFNSWGKKCFSHFCFILPPTCLAVTKRRPAPSHLGWFSKAQERGVGPETLESGQRSSCSDGVCRWRGLPVFQLGARALPVQTSCLLPSSPGPWFSTRPDFVPTSHPPPCTRGTWPCLETFLAVTNGVLLLVSSRCRPVLLLTIHTKTSPAPHASRVKGKNLCSRPWLLVRVSFPFLLGCKTKV